VADVTTGQGHDRAVLSAADEQSALDDHLGYERNDPTGRNGGNSRNGHRAKTVLTDTGPVELKRCTRSSSSTRLTSRSGGPGRQQAGLPGAGRDRGRRA
jgi:hypothetical protein